jgi:hypothetical protein
VHSIEPAEEEKFPGLQEVHAAMEAALKALEAVPGGQGMGGEPGGQ